MLVFQRFEGSTSLRYFPGTGYLAYVMSSEASPAAELIAVFVIRSFHYPVLSAEVLVLGRKYILNWLGQHQPCSFLTLDVD
jgi:hypothetical protein